VRLSLFTLLTRFFLDVGISRWGGFRSVEDKRRVPFGTLKSAFVGKTVYSDIRPSTGFLDCQRIGPSLIVITWLGSALLWVGGDPGPKGVRPDARHSGPGPHWVVMRDDRKSHERGKSVALHLAGEESHDIDEAAGPGLIVADGRVLGVVRFHFYGTLIPNIWKEAKIMAKTKG